MLMLTIISVGVGVATLGMGKDAVPQGALPSGILFTLGLLTWTAMLCWATATDDISRTVSRAMWALAVAAFLRPVGAVAFAIFGPPDHPDDFFPKAFIVGLSVFIALTVGPFCLALAKTVAPKGTPEKSIRFVTAAIGGDRVAIAAAGRCLLLAGVGVEYAGWRGVLN